MLNVVLFGPPGAGKGTQSERLIKKYHLTHLSTGDLFRMNISKGTVLGVEAQKYMNDGNLVPDELVIRMVDDKIKNTPDTNGVIFDGFPRTVHQAKALDELMVKNGTSIAIMLALSVKQEELMARLINRGKDSGRPDDQDVDKIKNRFKVYKRDTEPVAEYYKSQGKLVNIEGVGGIEVIFDRICDAIEAKV